LKIGYRSRTTALFSFPYKEDVAPSDIHFFDFGKPVLDFSVGDDARVIVQLDGAWASDASAETGNDTTLSPMVKVLKLSGGEVCFIYWEGFLNSEFISVYR
jgi:tRNA (guanine-N(7)-)-methyltransferase subunit TRM82